LDELGFKELTEVQEKAIPFVMKGEDVIVQSHTGTGKTAAFAIPIFEKIVPEEPIVQAIVLVPTRELAIQVANDFKKIGKFTGIRTLVVYGGVGLGGQMIGLQNGAQIVVGTPGRVLDLIHRNALDISQAPFFVLDEADLMLAMGFQRDVEKILSYSPRERQTLLFCVDFPEEILSLAKRHMRYPQHVKLVADDKSAKGVAQSFYVVESGKKLGALLFLLNSIKPSRALIFCKTKRRVQELTKQLNFNGLQVDGLQGDLSQPIRTKIMQAFKDGKISILLATDVASRGIHIEKISHIFNYELPHDINYYIHRIGRTGRMHEVGEAISLCYSDELGALGQIERLMGKQLEEKFLPENLPVPKSFKSHGRGNFQPDFIRKKRFGNSFGNNKGFRPKKRFSNNFSTGFRNTFKKKFSHRNYGEEFGKPISR